MKWHFQQHDGYADIDQSTAAEAFVSGNLRDLATALVRESLQNVLDAQRDAQEGPVRVRMTLGETSAEVADKWFDELHAHLGMPSAGLPDAPMPDETCRTLTVEDFGTTGLTGDYAKPYRQGEQNNFVNFLYHEGVTGKVGRNLGSRGVGKIVLLMASRARTKFAYTVQHDDPAQRPLLVGKNLLHYRTDAATGKAYGPKSYFLEDWPHGAAREPVQDPQATAEFAKDFGLTRDGQAGLSIVIPYLDQNVQARDLRRAIVAEYHYAILSGRLVVELAQGDEVETFDPAHLPKLGDPDADAMIRLARWAIAHPEPDTHTLPPTPGVLQRLENARVPDAVRQHIQGKLDERQPVSVRVPLFVHPKGSEPQSTWIDLHLEFADRAHRKPSFIREVLPVTDVRKARAAPQVRALVVVSDEPILGLLRAAEGANHTDWSPRTDEFKKKYKGRLGEIEFVATAVAQLIDIVRGEAAEPVGGIATQFFSAEHVEDSPKRKGQGKNQKPGDQEQELPDDLEPNPGAAYKLVKNPTGFTIQRNPARPIPSRLTVRVAYDVLRGSPWSKNAYDTADFDFRTVHKEIPGNVSVAYNEQHCGLKTPDPGNRLIVTPTDDDFEVIAHGFDPNRDLIVDVRDTTPRPKPVTEPQAQEADHERPADQLHEAQPADA
ncbi:MAG: hypothetical protein AAF288_00515 [Planctomycetota bacterium]